MKHKVLRKKLLTVVMPFLLLAIMVGVAGAQGPEPGLDGVPAERQTGDKQPQMMDATVTAVTVTAGSVEVTFHLRPGE